MFEDQGWERGLKMLGLEGLPIWGGAGVTFAGGGGGGQYPITCHEQPLILGAAVERCPGS